MNGPKVGHFFHSFGHNFFFDKSGNSVFKSLEKSLSAKVYNFGGIL